MLCGCLRSVQSNNNLYGKWTKDYCGCKIGADEAYENDIVTGIYWRSMVIWLMTMLED